MITRLSVIARTEVSEWERLRIEELLTLSSQDGTRSYARTGPSPGSPSI